MMSKLQTPRSSAAPAAAAAVRIITAKSPALLLAVTGSIGLQDFLPFLLLPLRFDALRYGLCNTGVLLLIARPPQHCVGNSLKLWEEDTPVLAKKVQHRRARPGVDPQLFRARPDRILLQQAPAWFQLTISNLLCLIPPQEWVICPGDLMLAEKFDNNGTLFVLPREESQTATAPENPQPSQHATAQLIKFIDVY